MIPGPGTVGFATLQFGFVGDAMGGQDIFEDVVFFTQGMHHVSMLLDGDIGGGNLLGIGLS